MKGSKVKKFVKKFVGSQGTCQSFHHVICLCAEAAAAIHWLETENHKSAAGEDSLLGILGVVHCMRPPSIETTMPSIADHGQMTQL